MSIIPDVYSFLTAETPFVSTSDNALIDSATLQNFVTSPISFIFWVALSGKNPSSISLPSGATISIGTQSNHDLILPVSAGVTTDTLNTGNYFYRIPNGSIPAITSSDNLYLYVNNDCTIASGPQANIYVCLGWVQLFNN